MTGDFSYRLQLVRDSLSPVRSKGEQYIHEIHHYQTINDALRAFFNLSIDEMHRGVARHIRPEYASFITEASIVQQNRSDKHILQLCRSLPNELRDLRFLYLYFPEGIRHFEKLTGLGFGQCDGYDPSSQHLLYGYFDEEDKFMTRAEGITTVVKEFSNSMHNRSTGEASDFTVRFEGYRNPDLLSNHEKCSGWHFDTSYHFATLQDAFACLMQTNLHSHHRESAFYHALDSHITKAYIAEANGLSLIGIQPQEEMTYLYNYPTEKGLYLQFYSCPAEVKTALSLLPKNQEQNLDEYYHLLASFNIHSRKLAFTDTYYKCIDTAMRHKDRMVSFNKGYQVCVHRESLAGKGHLVGQRHVYNLFPTIETAVNYLTSLNGALFDKHRAIKQGSFIFINRAVLHDLNNNQEVMSRFSDGGKDLLKINMTSISSVVHKALPSHAKPMEDMCSPHFTIALLNTGEPPLKRIVKQSSRHCKSDDASKNATLRP